MKFTESQLEQAFIDLLGQQSIPYVLGVNITRDKEQVLIEDDLKDFLLNRYQEEKLTEIEADQIIRDLKVLPSSDRV